MKSNKILLPLLTVIVIIAVIILISKDKGSQEFRLGVISAFTGDFANWGESTQVGVDLAFKEIDPLGTKVQVIYEDAGLDPKKGISALNKLREVDNVNMIYIEFTPVVVAVTSLIGDQDFPVLYNSPVVSPLHTTKYATKTFYDYERNCENAAQYFQQQGIARVGILLSKTEFGELCRDGIRKVYDESDIRIEEYLLGVGSLDSHILKLKSENVGVLFHPTFPKEGYLAFKMLTNLDWDVPVVVSFSTVTPAIRAESDLLKNTYTFGLPPLSQDMIDHLRKNGITSDKYELQNVAMAYVHAREMGEAIIDCSGDATCIHNKIQNFKPNNDIGFLGFVDRKADFQPTLAKFDGSDFININ